MKKIITVLLSLLMLMSITAFSVSAADFSEKGLSFSVPSELNEDAEWAKENGYNASFSDKDYKFEFNLLIQENTDGHCFTDYTADELDSYAEGQADWAEIENAEYTAEQVTVNGFEGVRADISGKYNGSSLKYIAYAFSTDSYVYWLDFYAYDEGYEKYVTDIMKTVKIEGEAYNYGDSLAVNSQSVTKEPKTISAEDGLLTFEIPAGYFSSDAGVDSMDELWVSDSAPLTSIGYFIDDNTDKVSFSNPSSLELTMYTSIFSAGTDGQIADTKAEKCERFGFKGMRITGVMAVDEYNCDVTIYLFSTKEKTITIYCYAYEEGSEERLQEILATLKINGEAYDDTFSVASAPVIGAIVGAIVGAIIAFVKKKKAKKKGLPDEYKPVTYNGVPDSEMPNPYANAGIENYGVPAEKEDIAPMETATEESSENEENNTDI
ncbi:MAG: hypothetical protein IJ491_08115 [Clostridia bacterium]|nr:hypothetical protein [Clostridia bacterium]